MCRWIYCVILAIRKKATEQKRKFIPWPREPIPLTAESTEKNHDGVLGLNMVSRYRRNGRNNKLT